MFNVTSELGGLDIWLDSLRECGLCPDEVAKELDHRMKRVSKLRGAERTGVDVGDIVKMPDVRGLRFRGRGGKFTEE